MEKISSGIKDLDNLLDSLYEGDNVVWEVEAGTSIELFIQRFIRQSLEEDVGVLYVSFNKSPQSILKQLGDLPNPEKLILMDAFTSGKGKDDRTFVRFYEKRSSDIPTVVKVSNPADINSLTDTFNTIQDKTPSTARYVFDSITGMQDLWDDEHGTYRFFTYMCPRLYDLETVAYWILENEAHSQAFKANLRHITQVVINLYTKGEHLYLKTLKLDNRTDREAFKGHRYEIDDGNVIIKPLKKIPVFNLGPKIKEYRVKLGMSQKELADRVALTPSFISQMENNQISPSLHSFMHICDALGISPGMIWQEKRSKDTEWFIPREEALESLEKREEGISIFTVVRGEQLSSYLTVIPPQTAFDGHFLYTKGEELIHVAKGVVYVTIGGEEQEMNTGDMIFLTDTFPSQWKNESGEEAELLIICS